MFVRGTLKFRRIEEEIDYKVGLEMHYIIITNRPVKIIHWGS